MTAYVHKKHKELEPSGLAYSSPRKNGHGRVVGEYIITIEDRIYGYRGEILKHCHEMRQYEAMGRHDLAEQGYWSIRYQIKQYKKEWRKYLKAMKKKAK